MVSMIEEMMYSECEHFYYITRDYSQIPDMLAAQLWEARSRDSNFEKEEYFVNLF